MDRFQRLVLGLCLAVALLETDSAGAQTAPGSFSGGSGVTTSGSRTETGAQAQVGTQSVIPTSGRNAHRGRGVSDVTCTFTAVNPIDPIGSGGGDVGNPNSLPEGTQSWRSCFSRSTGQRVSGPTLYTTPPPGAGGAPNVTGQLVDQALANIDIDVPTPHASPPGGTLPNIDTWFWTDETATQSASASAAGVTVTVTARLVSTTYEIQAVEGSPSTDDGVVLTCSGAPKPFDTSKPERDQTSTCTHRFAAPTRDLTIDATVTWQAGWTATNGTIGDLGTIERTATLDYRVQEKHTVIRTP